jgi:hypothetical protein
MIYRHGSLGLGFAAGIALIALSGCASVVSLSKVADRTTDQGRLERDIRVDTASREIGDIKTLAWAAYGVSFECAKTCPYTLEERTQIVNEIAETSYLSIDRELRTALSTKTIEATEKTVNSPAYSAEIKTESFKSTVSRWLDRIGLSRAPNVQATARNLKFVNPAELGWAGEESIGALGRKLSVDGVLIGHIRVVGESDGKLKRKLIVHGPKLWVFSSLSSRAVAVAELRPAWSLESVQAAAKLDWQGLDTVATRFSSRVAKAMTE